MQGEDVPAIVPGCDGIVITEITAFPVMVLIQPPAVLVAVIE
jgi:hypothetical protein